MTSANEFEGLVLPYGAVSDTGTVFEPGSLAGCHQRGLVGGLRCSFKGEALCKA